MEEAILNIAEDLENDSVKEIFRVNPQDFTRKRKLSFKDCVLFPCFFHQSDMQTEIDGYFENLAGGALRPQYVDRSAYSHARLKFSHMVYPYLSKKFIREVSSGSLSRRFLDKRVFGIDGTLIALPDEDILVDEFGIWDARNGKSAPRARVSAFFDCLNLVSYDNQIEPKSVGERELAFRHITSTELSSDDVITLDRGYAAHWLFQVILDARAHFCARMPSSWQEVKDFLGSESQDQVIELNPSHSMTRKCEKLGRKARRLLIRLVKVELPDGTIEVLATSITDPVWTVKNFKELYNLRWQTEENYKVIKCRIRMEKFIGKSIEAIRQEFHARMFMLNISSVIRHEAGRLADDERAKSRRRNKSRKVYKVNFKQALSRVRKAGARLFYGDIGETLGWLIRRMTDNLTRSIPGRKFPRNKRNTGGYHQAYSGI
ncbi:MAG: IS4 family transposase [Desulfobulbaceae bacterium]|nr:IS4 family transposase [Desulfobulbaceae bacterium]